MKIPRLLLFVALVLTAQLPVALAEAAPAAVATPRDEVVALVTRTLKAWEQPDPAGFLAAFAEDTSFAYPGGQLGKSQLGPLFTDLHARKQDVRIYVGTFLVFGNEFVVRYQFACTDRKTGKRQAVGTAVRGALRDGQIVKFKEYWDAHIAEDQARGESPLDEGSPDFPSPNVLMTPKRIN